MLETGCCGLAGSFGYEAGERYEVSVKAGEKVLLPRIRATSPHTLILTDGFSCRSQIEHGSQRSALHLAQAVQMAIKEGPNGPSTPRPESQYVEPPGVSPNGKGHAARAAGLAVAAGGAALAVHQRRSRR